MYQRKKIKNPNFLLKLLLLCMSTTCFALSSDAEKNMILKADKVTFNNKTKEANYLGHVFLQQGSAKLNANTARSFLDNENQLKKAIAIGNDLQKALFETLLDGKKKPLKGQAEKITYLPQVQMVKLEGKALLIQGSNTYKAPIIIYDMKNQKILSHKTQKQRTTITLNERLS